MKKLFAILLSVIMIFPAGTMTAFASADTVLMFAASESGVHTYSLSLSYDDRFDLAELGIPDDVEYVIYKTEYGDGEGITSRQVSKGQRTQSRDTALLTQAEAGSTEVIATGVGSGTVWLVAKDQVAALDKDESGTTDIYQIRVTVEPATLTLMFLTGQSNAEGLCDTYTDYDLGASVACKEGTVYSTYVPWSSYGCDVTGISFSEYCTDSNCSRTAGDFVAGSLSGDTNMSGKQLEYSIDSLTEGHTGKTGPDSGLAWEWNALTGDKVWVVNVAYEMTNISQWVPGGACYERAEAVWQNVLKTYNAEISAGHYTEGSKLVFWQQGETEDAYESANAYESAFDEMYTAMSEDLGMDALGIIMVRAGYAVENTGTDYRTEKDLQMSGPRIAQYWLGSGNSPYPDVYVVSNANEQWVSDSGVKSYFRNRYGKSLSYPTQNGKTSVPTTVKEVHYDIHYSQIGHNENGITAADGMYNAMNGASVNSVSWYDGNGQVISPPLTLEFPTEEVVAVPVADPVCAGKQIYGTSASGNVISYEAAAGIVTGASGSAGTGYIMTFAGNRMMTLSVTVNALPDLREIVGTDYTGLYKYDGTWWYLKNGVIRPDYEGVVKNENGWWYVNNGKVDFTYNGFAENSNGKWYIENGQVTFSKNSVIKDKIGAIGERGTWYYVVESKVQTDYTGVANYKNENGWWYIKDGEVDFTANTVAKNKNGWWYVEGGKVIFSYNGFAENGNGKWYIEDGKVTFTENNVLKDKTGAIGEKGIWYYVVGSEVQTSYTGVANYKNANGWWYIEDGKVDFTANTVAKNKNGWWYVLDGKVQFDFTGLANYKNENGWWYISDGKVDFTHNGVEKNKNGWWYVEGGKVIFSYNGIAQNSNGWWYIHNGGVDFSYNGSVTVDGNTYEVTNGKVAL